MSVEHQAATSVSYPVHEFTLANGLRVVVSPDHNAPAVAVNLWYDVGSRDEGPGESGLAHLFEHLMFEGSAHTHKGEHLSLMQSVGGQVNATTWFDRTNYFEAIPVAALDLALWLEADRLASVGEHLTLETLDNQREVVKSERRQRYDNAPYGDVLEHIVAIAFPSDHPYGHTTIGSMADLDLVTVDAARTFFDTHYGPNTAVLTLVGDITPTQGREAAERYFGDLKPIRHAARAVPASLPPLAAPSVVIATGRVPADAVYYVWRLPEHGSAELDALEYAFIALGSGQNSRLHRSLVRERNLASSIGTTIFELAGGNSIGLAYALGLPGSTAADLDAAISNELTGLLDGTTRAEHERATVMLERAWLSELASIDDRADRLGEYATLHGDPHIINTRLDRQKAIDRATVKAASQRWLGHGTAGILHYRRSDS